MEKTLDVANIKIDVKKPEISFLSATTNNEGYNNYANKTHTVVIKLSAVEENLKDNKLWKDVKFLLDNESATKIKASVHSSYYRDTISYEITLNNITGNGRLKIKIPKGAIVDESGNTNDEVIFDTGRKHGGEDFDFNIKLLPYIKNMVLIKDILYVHIVRPNLSVSAKYYDDVMDNFLVEYKKVHSVLLQLGCDFKLHPAYRWFYAKAISSYVVYGLKMGKNKVDVINGLHSFRKGVELDSKCTFFRFSRYVGLSQWILLYFIYVFFQKRFFNGIYGILYFVNKYIK